MTSNRTKRIVSILSAAMLLLGANQSSKAQYVGWDQQEEARTHITDLQHIEMHISFDEPAKKLMGTVLTTLTVLPQRDTVSRIIFDASLLNIQRVWLADGKKETALSFDTTQADKLSIIFPKPVEFNKQMTIGIQYTAQHANKGIYFMAPDTVYTERPEQIWTQGEGEDNHYWFPTYDYPNDKTTTEMFVTVRSDQQALSNGKLEGKKKNSDGTVTWHWVMDQPHSTYLVMLGIGKFDIAEDEWHGKPVQYWVYPGWKSEANRIFGLTPDMIDFYSRKTGVDYPWPKYAQIAIADFQFGGMENTTATTLNDYVLFDKKTAVQFSSEGLIAHELAHQWFGDYVTCRSWINTWLNESFATYFEAMYRQFHDGQDEFEEEMQGAQNAGLSAEVSLGKKPIVAAKNYTANIYPRGAATLNSLRHILGDQGWWASIHHYLEMHKFNNVEANDLKMAVEEATGQNVSWFFNEWLYKSGHPVYDVTYNYFPEQKIVSMVVNQVQSKDSLTGIFKMPIDVELTMPDGSKRVETVRDDDSSQNFVFSCNAKPLNVVFDKGNTIIKELHLHKSVDEWLYQLAHSEPAIERSAAAIELGDASYASSPQVATALANAAKNDPFHSTRQYAINSLARITDSLKGYEQLLVSLTHDANPEVRLAAVSLLPRLTDHALALHTAEQALNDSGYIIHASAIRVIYKLDHQRGYALALNGLNEKSPRDHIRRSMLDVLRAEANEAALDRAIVLIGERNIMKETRWETIKVIGDLAKVDSAKVYTALWNLTDNGDVAIMHTAFSKLADIGGVETLTRIKREPMLHPGNEDFFAQIREKMHKRLDPLLDKH